MIDIIVLASLQITNIIISGCVPVISNFGQSVSHSSCLGCCSLDRVVRRNNTMRPRTRNRTRRSDTIVVPQFDPNRRSL